MKKACMAVLVITIVLGFAERTLDEYTAQDIAVSQVDPKLQAIVDQMDRAKADGDIDKFKQLLDECNKYFPAATITDGPQAIIQGPLPLFNSLDPEPLAPLWGNDVVIDSAFSYGSISMDTRDDGVIWLAASRRPNNTAPYELQIWYSVDGGTWSEYTALIWSGYNIMHPCLKIIEQDDSTYLVVAFTGEQIAAPFEKDVYIGRLPFGGYWSSHPVSADTGVNERRPSIDSDDLQSPVCAYLYCAFESDDDIVFMRSDNEGWTWHERFTLGTGGFNYDYDRPSLAFGWHNVIDSCSVGVAWHYININGTEYIRFRGNRLYGNYTGWLDIVYLPGVTDHLDRYPSLTVTHNANYTSGCIAFSRLNTINGDNDLCIYRTQRGGLTWTNDTIYTMGVLPNYSCLAVDDSCGYHHCFFTGSNSDIQYMRAHYMDLSYPTGWTNAVQISDQSFDPDSTYPASAVRGGEPCVCWKEKGSQCEYLKFDGLWLPGIDEVSGHVACEDKIYLAPNPCSNTANLTYTLQKTGYVKISIFDAAGQLVNTLVNKNKSAGIHTMRIENTGLSQGVYFLRIETAYGTAQKKMMIIR